MAHITSQHTANPDSIYADEDQTLLVGAAESEQAGRLAEMLWLEARLNRPLRPHHEDRLRRALTEIEAIYEAQWLELEMAVGSTETYEARSRVEAGTGSFFEHPLVDKFKVAGGRTSERTRKSVFCNRLVVFENSSTGRIPQVIGDQQLGLFVGKCFRVFTGSRLVDPAVQPSKT